MEIYKNQNSISLAQSSRNMSDSLSEEETIDANPAMMDTRTLSIAQCCSSKRSIVLWTIMLLIALFSLFVVFGAVDLTPQRLRHSPIDESKDLLYTSVVISIYLLILFFNEIVISGM